MAYTFASGLDPSTVPADSGADISAGSSGWLSGLGGVFTSIGTAVSNTYRAVTTPTMPQAPVYNPQTGAYTVFNPTTGQYSVTPAPQNIAGINPNTLILIGAAVLLVVLLRR